MTGARQPSRKQPPRLLRSGLTGRVYVVTRYKVLDRGRIEALTKYDVTEDFEALTKEQE
jgi:hypothetical protein